MTDYTAEIRTYATSANLGPLFDRAGAKLDGLFMITSGELKNDGGLEIRSEGRFPVPTDGTNIAHKVAKEIFRDFQINNGLVLTIINNIKPGGLGTSGASAVAVVELISHLYGLELTTEQKISYAAFGEPNGHLDNVVPCIVGGIVSSSRVEGKRLPQYFRYNPPLNLVPAVIIPLDIEKKGGTAKAKEVLGYLTFSNEELVYASGLAELMIAGIVGNDFERMRESISAYSRWQKSATYVRNKEGVYGVDVPSLNHRLQKLVGDEAILTPSGAGPAMLIFAKDPDTAKKAASEAVTMYADRGHTAEGIVTSFNNTESKDNFV